MNVFYEKPGFLKCWHDPAHQMIVQDFDDYIFDFEEYKRQLDLCHQAIVKYKVAKWLTNSKRVAMPHPLEVGEYINNVAMPRAIQAGLKYHVTVIPDSGLGKITVKNWQSGVKVVGGLTMKNFVRLEDAIAWLDHQK